jgi:hypothetical protein
MVALARLEADPVAEIVVGGPHWDLRVFDAILLAVP